jgi:transposase-like protein
MKRTRRVFRPEFKTKVTKEALKEQKTIAELAKQYTIAPAQIVCWKKEFLANVTAAFGASDSNLFDESKELELHELLGQKEIEIAF